MGCRLIVFDVDGTLVEIGQPVRADVAEKLQNLENRGIQIALASGKNLSYLLGLARGMGIKSALVIGENGCVVFDPSNMEERISIERPMEISTIENEVLKRFSDSIWLSPNQVELTGFPREKVLLPSLSSFVREVTSSFKGKVVVLEHEDAIDVLPVGIDKGKVLSKMMKLQGIEKEEVVAVGDSDSDIPIFEQAWPFINHRPKAQRVPTCQKLR